MTRPRMAMAKSALVLGLWVAKVAHAQNQPAQPAKKAPLSQNDLSPQVLRQAGIDPAALRCNSENRWGATLRQDAKDGATEILGSLQANLTPMNEDQKTATHKKVTSLVMWRMVRAVLLEGNNNNLGAFALKGRFYKDAQGKRRQVIVFRSGLTPSPSAADSCFQSLLGAGGVRHVVNLFDGDIPATDLVAQETEAAKAKGASYSTATDDGGGYGPWRELLRSHYDEPDKRKLATESVARLIKEQILAPQGAEPKGNVHIHCGGGMHRSGMIAGIVERCVNGTPLPLVEAHYRYHVGFKDPAHPGGQEEGNLRFLREFDCSLLR